MQQGQDVPVANEAYCHGDYRRHLRWCGAGDASRLLCGLLSVLSQPQLGAVLGKRWFGKVMAGREGCRLFVL